MTTRIVFVGPLMFFSVVLCLSLTSLIPVCYTLSTEETSNRYECGPHGKFEYCIDGIPGCVIGCHCHPGYYFDTDTKICEPNTKLAQHFQRRYMAEPTRVYPAETPTVAENIPTPTTTSVLDERVDEITKDTDDIGDWLFDQFFKTIETQVINNTNDEPTLTRRSNLDVYRPVGLPKRGGGHKRGNLDINKIKTKTRKSWRGRGKKKKSKGHGLRRKLLRITEDDSLFDSDSNEDSSGDDSSDDSSSSGSSSSSSSVTSKEKKDPNNKNDREHGHKKVIIFNKRPRPPLPSFIFLPSMDTPYYPPIGLPPPPPVLPMYPMVPVPPMAPFIPFLERKNDNGNTTTTTAASMASDATGAESTTVTEASATEATSEAPEVPANPDPDDPSKHTDRRTRQKGHRSRIPIKMSSEETFMLRARDMPPRIPNAIKQAKRMKLLSKVHKLRQRLKKKNKLPPVQENVVTDEDEEDTLLDDAPIPPEQPLRPTHKQSRHRPQTEQDQILNDVNFKYITELIHRVNLSEANLSPAPINAKTELEKQLKQLQNTRRNYDPQIPNVLYQDENATPSNAHIQKPEDAYFTNLGRQIASLVRNVESKLDNNIVNEQGNREELTHPVLQENSYTPRLYWERSVRSPLTRFKNYFDRLNFKKQNGEKNLFSLEDEVKILATTTPSMSLQDLENILSTLQKTQTEDNKSNKSKDQSNGSFNVNLLPNKKTEDNYRKSISPLDYAEYNPRTKYLGNTTNISQDFTDNNATRYIDPSNLDSPMIDDWMFDAQGYKQTINSNQQTTNQQITNQHTTVNKSLERETTKYNSKPPVPLYKKVNKQKDYLKYHENHPLLTHNKENNFALSAKNHELPVNYPELHTRHAEQPIKYPVHPVKLPEPPTKYPELSAKYAEVSTKYPDISATYQEILTKYPDLPAKYPELLAKYPELSTRYSELSQKHPEVPSKYPMQPVKQPNPAVVNYKTLDYFSDAKNKRHHYTFEASYPLQMPSYRKSFSKRFETDPVERSYFHHELHHFDYIE